MRSIKLNASISGLFLFMLLNAFSNKLTAQEWKVKLQQQVPEFSVMDKLGAKKNIQALKGKVVLLNFFATWCPPCRQELPRLQKEIWDKWGAREDFEVMVLGREEGWDKLGPFAEQNNYTFPFYPDMKREVFSLFAENSIPRNMLIDKNGKIRYLSIGYSEAEFTEFIKVIEKALAE